jgi:hypothetical protein
MAAMLQAVLWEGYSFATIYGDKVVFGPQHAQQSSEG